MKSQGTHKYRKYGKRVKRRLPANLIKFSKTLLAGAILCMTAFVVFPSNFITSTSRLYDEQTAKLDFKVESVTIEGMDKLDKTELQALSGIALGDNIMTVDLAEVKSKMETNPWIASAVVERILPKTIVISLKEEIPQAVYVEGNKSYLINRKGRKLQEVRESDYPDYLVVAGNHANLNFEGVLDQLYDFPDTYKKIESLHFKGSRRWDVRLKNNILVKLPEANVYGALEVFEDNFGKISKLYKTCVVDLRLIPDKIYLKVIN